MNRRRLRPNTFRRDERGATLVEFALVISLFLLILFAMIDFGRLAYHLVNSQRAMQAAVRIAAVRPAACPGVPSTNERFDNQSTVDFGTSCGSGAQVCAVPDPVLLSCAGLPGNDTVDEIWDQVSYALPETATAAENLRFNYYYDPDLGFLGGPFVPIVTVQLQGVRFIFVTPLSALAAVAGATSVGTVGSGPITLPSISVSLPGEDLAQGSNG